MGGCISSWDTGKGSSGNFELTSIVVLRIVQKFNQRLTDRKKKNKCSLQSNYDVRHSVRHSY